MSQSQRVLITGVSSGIGLAAARRFAEAGYEVVGTARTPESASAASEVLCGVDVRALELRDANAISEFGKATVAEGPIDVLVNNAGLAVYGPIDQADEAALALQFETNVLAPIRLIREIAPSMRERRRGAIVNISSGSGFLAQPYDGLYAASKHALEGLSEALHWELKPFGVRVALIQLGRFDTPIREKIAFTAGFAEGNPHWPHYVRFHEAVERRLRGSTAGEDPSEAAAAILRSVETTTPQLRWLVGRDVEAAARWRSEGSFEDYELRLRRVLGLEELNPGAAKATFETSAPALAERSPR